LLAALLKRIRVAATTLLFMLLVVCFSPHRQYVDVRCQSRAAIPSPSLPAMWRRLDGKDIGSGWIWQAHHRCHHAAVLLLLLLDIIEKVSELFCIGK